jgi:uncharacterized repeat protein (TIGR03803 family)
MSPTRKSIFILALLFAFPHFLAASTLTTLVSFTGTNGATPLAGLVEGSDGNFYGTTYHGGSANCGTVFQLTPRGILTTLFNFKNDADGVGPDAGLIQGKDGNLYGTTSNTVFRITTDGTLTTLANVATVKGSAVQAGLIQDSAGNFYGTTYYGGSTKWGLLFKLTPGHTLSTLVNFDGTFGGGPNGGGLIQDSIGNFYGTTEGGGSGGFGTIFKLTLNNTLSVLVNFNRTNGANPAGIILGKDGNFYGTTKAGPSISSYYGTVFQVTPGGTLTTLITFNSTNGTGPGSGLIQSSDGNFYGTTWGGGSSGAGTVFQLVPVFGTHFYLNTLVNFNHANGESPQAALIQDLDGNFYGTTSAGGSAGKGTVFKYELTAWEKIYFPALLKWAWLALLAGVASAGLIVAVYLRRRIKRDKQN